MKNDLKQILEELKAQAQPLTNAAKKLSDAEKIDKAEAQKLFKKIDLKYVDGDEDRIIPFLFTDGSLNRLNQVIDPKGVDLKDYQANPVVLLFHDGLSFPVGRSVKTFYDKERECVVGHIFFFDDDRDLTGMSETTFRMVESGGMNSGSIGFKPDWELAREANPQEKVDMGVKDNRFVIMFPKVQLIEFSLLPVGANKNSRKLILNRFENGNMSEQALDAIKNSEMLEPEECELIRNSYFKNPAANNSEDMETRIVNSVMEKVMQKLKPESTETKNDSVFKTGEMVQLNSGGPIMTVGAVEGQDVYCNWFNADGLHSGKFSDKVLKNVNEESSDESLSEIEQLLDESEAKFKESQNT